MATISPGSNSSEYEHTKRVALAGGIATALGAGLMVFEPAAGAVLAGAGATAALVMSLVYARGRTEIKSLSAGAPNHRVV